MNISRSAGGLSELAFQEIFSTQLARSSIWGFRKIGVPYRVRTIRGSYYLGIYIGGPLFSQTPISLFGWGALRLHGALRIA